MSEVERPLLERLVSAGRLTAEQAAWYERERRARGVPLVQLLAGTGKFALADLTALAGAIPADAPDVAPTVAEPPPGASRPAPSASAPTEADDAAWSSPPAPAPGLRGTGPRTIAPPAVPDLRGTRPRTVSPPGSVVAPTLAAPPPPPIAPIASTLATLPPAFRSGGAPAAPPPGSPPEVVAALADPQRRVGRYALLAELGRGGMGAVWRAWDPAMGRPVALKLILSGEAGEQDRERFRREASAAGQLRHPGIVAVHDVGEDRGRPFLVMELVDGQSLSAVLREGPMPEARLATIVRDLALALDQAHRAGISHRDVKPANVLLGADDRPRLTDFGIARLAQAGRMTATGQLLGTPDYMAPEQAAGEVSLHGPPADVYALGGILYHGLCGQGPHGAGSTMALLQRAMNTMPEAPSRLRHGVSPALEALALRCLAKAPGERPSAMSVAAELDRFLSGGGAAPAAPGGRGALAAAGLVAVGVVVASLVLRTGLARPGGDGSTLAPPTSTAPTTHAVPPPPSPAPPAPATPTPATRLVVDAVVLQGTAELTTPDAFAVTISSLDLSGDGLRLGVAWGWRRAALHLLASAAGPTSVAIRDQDATSFLAPRGPDLFVVWNGLAGEMWDGDEHRPGILLGAPQAKLQLLATGEQVVVASFKSQGDLRLAIWRDLAGAPELVRLAGDEDEAWTLAVAPGDRFVAVGMREGEVLRVRLEPGADRSPRRGWRHDRVPNLPRFDRYCRHVAFDRRDPRLVHSVGRDGTLRTWSTTGGPPRVIHAHPTRDELGGALGVASLPDGCVATCGEDGAVRLWSTDGERLGEAVVSSTRATLVAAAPDGAALYVGDAAGAVTRVRVSPPCTPR